MLRQKEWIEIDLDDLPNGTREYFSQFMVPVEVPRAIRDAYVSRASRGEWGSVMYAAENVAPMEFFLSIRGLSLKTWPYTREGYIGTAAELSQYRTPYLTQPDAGGLVSCEEAKQKAIDSLTQWWKKRPTQK